MEFNLENILIFSSHQYQKRKNHKKKKVTNGIQIYESCAEACRSLGLERHAIANAIFLRCRCGGFYWKYV